MTSASACATVATSICRRSLLRRSSSAAMRPASIGSSSSNSRTPRSARPIRPPALMRGPSRKPRCQASGGPLSRAASISAVCPTCSRRRKAISPLATKARVRPLSGTVADVVPLKGLNRACVAKGLIALRRREHVGQTALMDAARLSGPPEAWHLGFLLGPRINAGGRIGRADLGVRLLLEEDPSEAARIAAELDRLNRERQQIDIATVTQAEAEAMAALGLEEKGALVVTAVQGWHPGVVGLVAARLKAPPPAPPRRD